MPAWKWVPGLVLVTGTIAFWATVPGAPKAPSYVTSVADRGVITSRVTATGTLSALVTVQVGSQVSGRIRELNADYNANVSKNQILARLDPQLFEAALAQAQANYAAAKATLTRTEALALDKARGAQRSQSLVDRRLIALADAESAQASAKVALADVAAARAGLQQSRAALEHARINLGYTTITSPIDGVVISRNVDVGQTVAASLQAPVLFEIAEDLRRMQVHTSVAEADIGALRPGQTATFTVDAHPTLSFSGSVRQIRNAAAMVQNVVTYDAVIDVLNPDLNLKPGMTANVAFIVAEAPNALRVPNAALRFRPEGDRGVDLRAVYILRSGQLERIPIDVGISDGRYTEVVSGAVEAGDRVVIGRAEPIVERNASRGLF